MRLAFASALALALATTAHAQLSGTYTVGGLGPDYATLTDAFDDLAAVGVDGPVTFRVRAGTYTEQLSMNAVPGASSVNTVTVEAFNAAFPPTVAFDPTPADDYVLRLENTDHVTFRNLQFEATPGADAADHVVVLYAGATGVAFEGCRFEATTGDLLGASDVPTEPTGLEVTGSTFVGGRYGVTAGALGQSTTDVVIATSTFTGQSAGAIRLQAVDGATVSANVVADDATAAADYAGIDLQTNAYDVVLDRNEVTVSYGAAGVRTGTLGGLEAVNNTVSVGGAAAVAAVLAKHANLDLVYNTFLVRGTAPSSARVVRIEGTPSAALTSRLLNSLLINRADGPALQTEQAGSLTTEDANSLYTTGATLVRWGGTGYGTLEAYRAATGQGALSVSRDADFVAPAGGDLRLEGVSVLDPFLLATPLPEVAADLDGTVRDAAWPHMGAHEPAAFAALAGTYAVGGPSPDYLDPLTAARALRSFGVSADATFQVHAGTYDGWVYLADVAGASATARIRFEAADPLDRPVLQFSGADALANSVVTIEDTGWVTLRELDVVAAGPAPYGRLLVLRGDASDVTVRLCTFTGLAAPGSDDGTLIWTEDAPTADRFTLDQSTLTGGYYGLRIFSPSNAPASELVVSDNTLTDQEMRGVSVFATGRIEGNVVEDGPNTAATYTGISMVGSSAYTAIAGNTVRVLTADGGAGIFHNSSVITTVNNVVTVASENGQWGIYAANGTVVHNTVRTRGMTPALIASSRTLGVTVRNNVLVVEGTGAALRDSELDTGDILAASDHNLLYTTAGALVEWEGAAYTTLAAWQAASGLDASSVSAAVTFADAAAGDLHLAGASLDDGRLIAAPFAGVPEVAADLAADFDGDARDAYNPKMGADEGTPLPPLDDADAASGFYTVGGTSPSFADPDEAFAALAARGMKGPVTFRVRAGTYTVRASLRRDLRVGPAAAAPAAAPLLVRAAIPTARPTLVSGAASGTNWTLRLRGLDHVTLENLDFDASAQPDYGRALVLEAGADGGGADDVTVTGCTFTGPAIAPSDELALVWSDSETHDRLVITGSTFTNGWAGISITDSLPESDMTDVEITDNVFGGQREYGLFVIAAADVTVRGNVLTSSSYDAVAVHLSIDGDYAIERNQVVYTGGRSVGLRPFGAYMASGETGVVANNLVRAGQPISLESDTNGARIVHNTLYASGDVGAVVTTQSNSAAPIAELTNNILYSATGGVPLVLADLSDLAAADGNAFYTSGPTLVEVDGAAHADLAAWRAASGLDGRSRVVNVTFANVGAGDLHLDAALAGDPRLAGLDGVGVADDVDGEARPSVNPYIGADELATALAPLAGTYTVGTPPPDQPAADFATLQGALDAVAFLGVSAATALELHADVGGFPVTALPFDGASETNRLTVRPLTAGETFVHAPSSADDDGAFRIEDADFVTLAGFGLDVSGAPFPYGVAVRVTGEVEGLRLAGLFPTAPAWGTLVYVPATTHGLTVEDGTFTGGQVGIFGDSEAAPSTDTHIAGAEFSGQAGAALHLVSHDGPTIEDVEIASGASAARGILLRDGLGATVARARVHLSAEDGANEALWLSGQSGTAEAPLTVTNSFLSGPTAVDALQSDGAVLAHNTLRATGPAAPALAVGSGSGLRLLNNLLVASGPALDVADPAAVAEVGANDLHTDGATLAEWGGTAYADLAAFQAGTGLCGGCVSVPVTFADAAAGDLHLGGASDGDAALTGEPLADVTTDIDGEDRSTTAPYLGADEASEVSAGGVTFSVSVYLQGAYAGSGTMSTALAGAGLVPLTQPYADPAYDGTALDYDGTESVASVPADVVDWVILGLRETPAGPDVARRALFLTEDGQLRVGETGTVLAFDGVAPGTYHAIVYHRNHIPLLSTAYALSGTFQTVGLGAPSNVYGGAGAYAEVQNGTATLAALWAADGSADGQVTAPDFNLYGSASGSGASGYLVGDYTLDGQVTAPDFNLYNANATAGAASGVPED